ncbi:SPbeta prophage-derived endonuclease YokF [Paraliobacillus ryukyuensis]|uniref:Micrococcal nuclease n=1 Tax=Paraliobacillus ryukyuensis TaxID=200904 RepID=A0A366E7U5_9BACI|nr:thermonuclease family protein [Paraliobacillus ryukyuensis]RBO98155.1 micrococcal nuclease [Paraliobacillus ryukyuensis]
MQPKKLLCLLVIWLLLILAGCALDNSTNSTEQPDTVIAKVKRVIDGDTIQVEVNGQEENVRMLLVDTPETKHPNLPKQPFGEDATAFAKEILTDQNIKLEFDGPTRDKYDRLLAYIWIDGKLFNEWLLEKGLARYAYEYDPPYTYKKQMKQAENNAAEQKLGIWSITNYVTEEGFQFNESETEITNNIQAEVNSAHVYQTCKDARKASVTPLYRGDKGYSDQLDGDGDGVACE